MTNATTNKLQDDYMAEHAKIRKLIAKLEQKLRNHARDFNKSGMKDWGYLGDLEHMTTLLTELNDCSEA